MSSISFECADKAMVMPQTIQKEPFRNARLPRLETQNYSFLGWRRCDAPQKVFMNYADDDNVTLQAALTQEPAYIIESHYRGDVNDYTGKRCQYRRYVVDVYLENAQADHGAFRLDLCNDFLYYLGHVPVEGIALEVDAPSWKYEGQYHYEADNFQTDYIAVSWTSEEMIDARQARRKIARIMLYFSRWGLGYSEIAARSSDSVLRPELAFAATAGACAAQVSANFYLGVRDYEASSCEDFACTDAPGEQAVPADDDEVLSRFALMSDTHVGVRYQWGSYDWLYSAYDHIGRVHAEKPLDFVAELGDSIDDGYAASYQPDYKVYLEEVKRLTICDPVNPIENRAPGTIPHYEIQGNHDTSMDTRFFRNRMWHTETSAGERVYYIAFFTQYGGYPLIPYEIVGNYDAYRSYGVITDETVDFVEKSIRQAVQEQAAHIVLLCHFGIARELYAPILPETGLGKLAMLCRKYHIQLYFNGHEHNKAYNLYRFNGIYDYDAAMTKDKYAIVEIRRHSAVVTIYNTQDNSVFREDHLPL